MEPNSLLVLIQESLRNNITDSYSTPTLPKNTIYYGVAERFSQYPTIQIVIERDACIRPYNHFGEEENVGYPKLLFAYKIVGSQVATSAVVAAVDELVKPQTPVYAFPYGNTFNNGNICMGSFHYPQINPKDLTDINYFPEAFYLIEHDQQTNSKGQIIREILDRVKEKPFDNNLLVFHCTFEQWIEGFSK